MIYCDIVALFTGAILILAQCPMELSATTFIFPTRNMTDYITESKLVQFVASGSGNYTHITTSPLSIYVVSNGNELLRLRKDDMSEISRFSAKAKCPTGGICDQIKINIVQINVERLLLWYCFAHKVFSDNAYKEQTPHCHMGAVDSSFDKFGQWTAETFISSDFEHKTTFLIESHYIYTGLHYRSDKQMHIFKNPLPFGDTSIGIMVTQLPINFLRDPGLFLLSFKSKDSIYFLYVETDTSCGFWAMQMQTRLLRICNDDPGNEAQKFTALAKVNINCEQRSSNHNMPGHIYSLASSAAWMPLSQQLIVGFVSKKNENPSTTLCVYSIKAIEDAFNSEPKTTSGESSRNHSFFQNTCNDFTLKSSDQPFLKNIYNLSASYPMRKMVLSNVSIYLELDAKIAFISFDESKLQHPHQQVILLLGLDYKVQSAILIISLRSLICILEKFLTTEKITALEAINSEKPMFYIGTSRRLFILPMDRCLRYTTEEDCISVVNPYCGWSTASKLCVFIKSEENLKILTPLTNKCQQQSTVVGDYSLGLEIPCVLFSANDALKQIGQCHCRRMFSSRDQRIMTISNDCIVDGGWSSFSEWSDCSVTCETGLQSRRRSCDNPFPQNGGRKCEGLMIENRRCSTTIECKRNDNHGELYSEWSPWSSCSKTCGFSTKQRTRYCIFGNCFKSPSETQLCPNKPCEGTLFAEWSSWSVFRHSELSRKRFRTLCSHTYPYQPVLLSIKIVMIKGNRTSNCMEEQCFQRNSIAILDGRWSQWSMWSSCSASCGIGIRSRSRECSGGMCFGSSVDYLQCNIKPCQTMLSCWSKWVGCSIACEIPKTKSRYRICIVGQFGKDCDSNIQEKSDCSLMPCKSYYSPWSAWSSCHQDGIIMRTRKCKSKLQCRFPLLQSKPCAGANSQQPLLYSTMYMIVAGLVGLLGGLLIGSLSCYIWWRCTNSVIKKAGSASIKSSTANQLEELYNSQSIHTFPETSFSARNRSSSYSDMYNKRGYMPPILHRSESYGYGLQPIQFEHSTSYSTLKRHLPEVVEV